MESEKLPPPKRGPPVKKPPIHETLSDALQLSTETIEAIKNGFDKCSKEEIDKTLDELIPHLLDRLTPDASGTESAAVMSMLSFLKTLSDWSNCSNRHLVQNLFTLMSLLISDDRIDSTWRSSMVALITKFVQTTHYNEHSKFGLLLLQHLFSVALPKDDRTVTGADIRRIKDLKCFILSIDLLEPVMSPILAHFMSAIISKAFLRSRDGILVLAYFLSKHASLTKTIQNHIRENLSELTPKVARSYGEIYFHAWILADDGSAVKTEIEQQCIQDIMLRSMTLKRNGLSMGPIGVLCFAILQSLRANRRLTKFSRLITELYQPILWRNLKSANAVYRCNAAQIFFDVFPLEKVGAGATENWHFKDMQVKEMKDLLLDECHLIRILAIRGIGVVLTKSSAILSVNDIKEIMDIISNQLVYDVSSYLVRAAVFEMFETLIADDHARSIGFPIMKRLELHLHDENEKVRKAFVKVLLRLKEVDEPSAPFWEVSSLKPLLLRLKEEGPLVGELLVKLLFDMVYKSGQPVPKTMSNLVKIIKISPAALINLFKYSKKSAKTEDAFYVIVSIVGTLVKNLDEKSYAASEVENATASTSSSGAQKPRKKSRTLQDVTNASSDDEKASDDGSSSAESESNQPPPTSAKPNFLDEHKIVSGLLNGASVLWATHADQLAETERTSVINDMAVGAVSPLLLYYKGTRVYYNVISFASLVPIQQLATQSTICGMIIAELREMDETSDPEIMQCLMMAMCLWGRGLDIVELATDWLNQAFRHENLNSTLVPRSKKKRPRKHVVRFQPYKGKPLLAVRLLEMMFNHVACEKRLITKSYDQLFDFFLYLERIKDLLERRMVRGKAFEEHDLCDEFLEKCLKVYLDMILMLHRPDRPPADVSYVSEADEGLAPLDGPAKITEMVDWASTVFFPHLTDGDNDQFEFAANCFYSVMKIATISLDLSLTNKEHANFVALVAFKLLTTGRPAIFLESAFDLLRALCAHSLTYNGNDEWGIFSMVVPNIVKCSLELVSKLVITTNDLPNIAKNPKKFKLDFFDPLVSSLRFHGISHPVFQTMVSQYISACVNQLVLKAGEVEELEVYLKLDNLPFFVALIMKFFLSKNTLRPLILPQLIRNVDENQDDPNILMATISLLSTLVTTCKSKFDVQVIESCIEKCHQKVKSFKDDEELVTIGEEMLMNLCRESGCALLNPLRTTT